MVNYPNTLTMGVDPCDDVPMTTPLRKATCGAYYGTGDRNDHGGAAVCVRPEDHPPVSEDGIGHSYTFVKGDVWTIEAPAESTPASRVQAFLDARDSMGDNVEKDSILTVWVKGEQHILYTADLRAILEALNNVR